MIWTEIYYYFDPLPNIYNAKNINPKCEYSKSVQMVIKLNFNYSHLDSWIFLIEERYEGYIFGK